MVDKDTKTIEAYVETKSRGNLYQEMAKSDPLGLFSSVGFTPYNPSTLITRKGMKIFDDMRRDEQVKAAMGFKKHAVLSSGWEIVSPEGQAEDWEVTEFVKWNLEQYFDDTLEEALLGVLTALDYGYSVSELIWEKAEAKGYGNKIALKAIKNKRPHEFDFRADEYGELLPDGIIQRTGIKDTPLPVSKFILFSYEKEFGNHYGKSDLESVYRSWWIKDNGYKWFAMMLERLGIPPIFALYDPSAYTVGQLADLKNVISKLQAATTGIIPKGRGENSLEFWNPELAGESTEVFVKAFERFDLDITRALLMPGLIGATGDATQGSLARANVHFDMFMLAVEYIRGRIEGRVMQEQVVKRLVDLNFSVDEYPVFKFLPIAGEVRTELLNTYITAVEKGIVVKQESDEVHLRKELGFPEIDENRPEPVVESTSEELAAKKAEEDKAAADKRKAEEEVKQKVEEEKQFFNPNHDESGRFASGQGGGTFTTTVDSKVKEAFTKDLLSKNKEDFGAGIIDDILTTQEIEKDDTNSTSLFVVKKGALTGAINYEVAGKKGYLHLLGILPSEQGKGTGSALLMQALKDMKSKGVETVHLNAAPTAVSFYEKIGFTKVSSSGFKVDVDTYLSKYKKYAADSDIDWGKLLEEMQEIEKEFPDVNIEVNKQANMGDEGSGSYSQATLSREVNKYEQVVNFNRIDTTLTETIKTTRDALVKALSDSREALKSFVFRNWDKLPILVKDVKIKGMNDVESILREFMRVTFEVGRTELRTETYALSPSLKNMTAGKGLFTPTEALAYLNSKAFWIKGIIRDQLVKDAQAIIYNAIQTGELPEETIQKLHQVFEPYVGDPFSIVDDVQLEPFRLETILRTNATDAFNQGRLTEARSFAPGLILAMEFSAILDDRTTEICRELDGRLFRMDDPDLDRFKPPLHFNCRSMLVAVPAGIEIDKDDFVTGGIKGAVLDLMSPGFGGNITKLAQEYGGEGLDPEVKKEEPKEDINSKFETLRHELIEAINNQGKKDADTDTFAKEVIVSLSSMVNAQNISFKELVEALDRNKQPTNITVESSPIELTLKLEQDGKTTNKQVTFKKDAAGNLIGAVIQEKEGNSDAM